MKLFDDDVAVSEAGAQIYEGAVSQNWLVNGNPNGGYLMAIAANAMLQRADRKSTPIVTANYIARCAPGPALVHVEEFSRSTQFHRLEARLMQEGKEKVRVIGTFANEKNDCAIERYESSAPDMPPFDECVRVPELPKFSLLANLDMRLDPASAGWMKGTLAERSEQRGWIRFRDGGVPGLTALFLFADALPPAIFVTQGMTAWIPTIELTVNIRNLPQGEWLRCSLRTRFITCGLLEADGEVWDEAGNLVAISRQIAQFRPAPG
ncbi:MAG: thioesterase family protein [Spirochaetes bacterium]|nr:MAG: thioesterase family protein [Spirochaetota bacterium]